MPDGRKLENAALALPVFGVALIVPPVIGVFNAQARVFGIPLEVLYLFGVWIGLILITAALSSRMRDPANFGQTDTATDEDTEPDI